MITDQPDFDLSLLAQHFTECGDYTKDVILEELEYWKKSTDFLVLISETNNVIDGFLIGYRSRNSLWLAQGWHKGTADLNVGGIAIEMAKKWAKERGMTSLTFETSRNEMRAMKRKGFEEYSINVRCKI